MDSKMSENGLERMGKELVKNILMFISICFLVYFQNETSGDYKRALLSLIGGP
jgi:hypothetical protein